VLLRLLASASSVVLNCSYTILLLLLLLLMMICASNINDVRAALLVVYASDLSVYHRRTINVYNPFIPPSRVRTFPLTNILPLKRKKNANDTNVWSSLFTKMAETHKRKRKNTVITKITLTTRNTFCGTWYLPHSHVHNERTVLL